MTRPVLSNATARAIFLDRHGLAIPRQAIGRGARLAGLVDALGFVQVDSVNTLARAHDMILFSRASDYRPASLRWLNDRSRDLFEGWTHDAAMIPTEFFPYWQLKFTRDKARLAKRWKDWHGTAFHAEIETVLRHVADHGACTGADVASAPPQKSTGWWDWHPSKTALEYLWRIGELCISRRDGFRKRYDLTARVIPPALREIHLPKEEIIDWACDAALDRLGFATSGELAAFWALVTPAEAKLWADAALARGALCEVDITLADGSLRRSLMRPEAVDAADREVAPRLRILSPFDPALRDRNRAERLFGFHYRIEIFVPEARRRYGYYVFPVIEAARLIGRIDMAADRAAGVTRVRAFWPEAGVRMGQGRRARLEAEIARLARFAEAPEIAWMPGWIATG